MKKIFLMLCVSSVLFGQALAQSSDPPFSHLKNDFNQVAVVAHIRVEKAETVDSIGGYVKNRIYCEVVESFKGGLKKGQKLEFNSVAETGHPLESYNGDKIAFLEKHYDKENKQSVLIPLENSLITATDNVIANMRRLKSAKRRR